MLNLIMGKIQRGGNQVVPQFMTHYGRHDIKSYCHYFKYDFSAVEITGREQLVKSTVMTRQIVRENKYHFPTNPICKHLVTWTVVSHKDIFS